MDKLISSLIKNFSLSNASSKQLSDVISTRTFNTGDIFVKKGLIESNEFLMLEGICRSYVIDSDGNEITLSFFTPNKAISPNLTRTKKNISILNIQAITSVKLAVFSSNDLMLLMESNREIEIWANQILQKELTEKVDKEIAQISLNAKDRLLTFRNQFPLLENMVPHAYIASYLGITNVSLSRLRRDLMSK